MTVFLDWRFLNVAKRGKNLAGLSLFAFVFMRSYGEGGCTKRLSLTQKPFATDAADVRAKTRNICKDCVAEHRV